MAANFDAIALLDVLEAESRAATAGEQARLARWSGWGAVPGVFDEYDEQWRSEREHLRSVLGEDAYAAARRTTINAHYTDPAYASAMWDMLTSLGFDGGAVLEPGCGAGTFLGLAPSTADVVGVELDPTSARVAAALYPDATVRAESFADTRYPGGHFDAVIGNVPFANVRLHDPRHNPGGHTLHNHAIIKSLGLTRPGGLVAVLTSHFTLDAQNPAARREMNALADLIGTVRLPTGAHRRAAGTEVVTDLLVFRRRDPDTPPVSTLWETVTARRIGEDTIRVNSYFDHHPQQILGELRPETRVSIVYSYGVRVAPRARTLAIWLLNQGTFVPILRLLRGRRACLLDSITEFHDRPCRTRAGRWADGSERWRRESGPRP